MSEATPAKPAPNTKVQVSWGEIGKQVKDKFDCFPQPTVTGGLEAFLLKNPAQLLPLMKHLKEQLNFPVLLLMNVVEYKDTFQVIYQLQRISPDHRIICVKVNIDKANPTLASLTGEWGISNWYEREMWDMHGIKFNGHPNLTRILNPDNWEGFPLRKDYIPPIDALNGPITAVKANIKDIDRSVRADVEVIEEPNLK